MKLTSKFTHVLELTDEEINRLHDEIAAIMAMPVQFDKRMVRREDDGALMELKRLLYPVRNGL